MNIPCKFVLAPFPNKNSVTSNLLVIIDVIKAVLLLLFTVFILYPLSRRSLAGVKCPYVHAIEKAVSPLFVCVCAYLF